jgi:uncharacterized protein (TIGR00255 family)
MESMTGFSRFSKENKDSNYSLQVKSLNARFLEFKFHMPPALSYLEEDFRKEIKKTFLRGTFEINFYFKKSNLDVPLKTLKPWIAQYKKMARNLGVADDLTMTKVLYKASNESDYSLKPQEKKAVLDAFKKVLNELQKRRLTEGRSLKGVLQKEISNIHKELKLVKAELKKIKMDTRRDWTKKFKKIGLESDQSKLESEVALILEKADITEEVDRLGIHLKEFTKILNAKTGLKGKKLDFFCQELAREANTISSKSKSTELTRLSVNLKSNVEKMRQQVQNIQ